VNITRQNVVTPLNFESALRHVDTGTVQLAPMTAGAYATRMPSTVSPDWEGSRKALIDVPTQAKGSPQSRGRLAHT
jgi:hypothetical protein